MDVALFKKKCEQLFESYMDKVPDNTIRESMLAVCDDHLRLAIAETKDHQKTGNPDIAYSTLRVIAFTLLGSKISQDYLDHMHEDN